MVLHEYKSKKTKTNRHGIFDDDVIVHVQLDTNSNTTLTITHNVCFRHKKNKNDLKCVSNWASFYIY